MFYPDIQRYVTAKSTTVNPWNTEKCGGFYYKRKEDH